MPNEIFDELKDSKSIKGSSHVALSYSYIYLVTWLYRYTKYSNTKTHLDQKKLKQILGYNENDKRIDYLIKKNGVLEQMKYLETTRNFPIDWEFEDGDYNEDDILAVRFNLLNDFRDSENRSDVEYYNDMKKYNKNIKIKYPIKAFIRENDYGTFYKFDNTHLIPFEVFIFCIGNDDIGVVGFYLWSYLKSKNQIYTNGYDVSFTNLSDETGINIRTLTRYIDSLKKYQMIKFNYNQDYFVWGLTEENRKATTYITNEYELFSDKPVAYEKIKKMSYENYLKLQEYKDKIEKVTFCP